MTVFVPDINYMMAASLQGYLEHYLNIVTYFNKKRDIGFCIVITEKRCQKL